MEGVLGGGTAPPSIHPALASSEGSVVKQGLAQCSVGCCGASSPRTGRQSGEGAASPVSWPWGSPSPHLADTRSRGGVSSKHWDRQTGQGDALTWA